MLSPNNKLPLTDALSRIINLFKHRGYKNVKRIARGGNYIFIGSGQCQADHPRDKADLLAYYYTSEQYSKDGVRSLLNLLHSYATNNNVSELSGILIIYSFPMVKNKLEDIENIYNDICEKTKCFYLEMIHISTLYEDRSFNRSTRNWRLVKKEITVMMIGNDGKDILVDKPPMILMTDPVNAYYGGRIGDRYEFERLTSGEIGEMWIPDMREVSEEIRERKKKKDDQW